MTSITRSSSSKKSKTPPKDAIALLKADHAAVSGMFAEYGKKRTPATKMALVKEICTALGVPAQIEEEIFIPT
jgi:hypothetical protein